MSAFFILQSGQILVEVEVDAVVPAECVRLHYHFYLIPAADEVDDVDVDRRHSLDGLFLASEVVEIGRVRS